MDGRPRVLMTEMIIRYEKLTIFVSVNSILIEHRQMLWGTYDRLERHGNVIEVNGLFLKITLKLGVEVLMSKRPCILYRYQQGWTFLNIEVENEYLLSLETTGILGLYHNFNSFSKEV